MILLDITPYDPVLTRAEFKYVGATRHAHKSGTFGCYIERFSFLFFLSRKTVGGGKILSELRCGKAGVEPHRADRSHLSLWGVMQWHHAAAAFVVTAFG